MFAPLKRLYAKMCARARRVYFHLLLVIDDAEFHSDSGALHLGQQRSIATAFNTLVFRTHCPAPLAAEVFRRAQPASSVLAEWAPVLLRCDQPTRLRHLAMPCL